MAKVNKSKTVAENLFYAFLRISRGLLSFLLCLGLYQYCLGFCLQLCVGFSHVHVSVAKLLSSQEANCFGLGFSLVTIS